MKYVTLVLSLTSWSSNGCTPASSAQFLLLAPTCQDDRPSESTTGILEHAVVHCNDEVLISALLRQTVRNYVKVILIYKRSERSEGGGKHFRFVKPHPQT